MANTFSAAFYKEFKDSVYMNIEAAGDVFSGKARMESIGGETTFLETLGSIYAENAPGGVATATPLMEPGHDVRAMAQVDLNIATMIGKIDAVKTLVNFESFYVKRMAQALDRKKDIQFIKGALGTAVTGKDLGSTAAFDFANQTIASGATGLNVDKLRKIKALFWNAGYDPTDKIYLAVTGAQKADLLAEVEVGSADYNTVKTNADGDVTGFMGIELVQCERLPYILDAGGVNLNWDATDKAIDVDANNTRACFAWIDRAVAYGMNPEVEVRVSERDDLRYNWQAYSWMGVGSVRMEEAGVALVPCVQA